MVRPLSFDELEPSLREALRPKYERLGYLGSFFAHTAHQPVALRHFHEFTEELKGQLDWRLAEVVALSCAHAAASSYERTQHEQLAAKLGATPAWIASIYGSGAELTEAERAVRDLCQACLADRGIGAQADFGRVTALLGEAGATAVLLLIGRCVAHATVGNTLGLTAPVAAVVPTTAPEPGAGCWLTEHDVAEVMTIAQAIEAVETGLRLEAAGQATPLTKTMAVRDGRSLHALGAAVPGWGVSGAKVWSHTPGGAAPVVLLLGYDDGQVRAVIEAFALGQLRTSATSAIGTAQLAHPDADELAIIGTGKQSFAQVAGVAAVRPLRRVRVWGRRAEPAAALAARITAELGLDAQVCPEIGKAVAGAPIVTVITRAKEPLITGDMLAPGTHVNGVGAILPGAAELDASVLARCSLVSTDSVPQARASAAELRGFFGDADEKWAQVQPLSAVVAAAHGRPPGADLTLLKPMGIGLADVSIGVRCLELATERGLGQSIPPRRQAAVRWTA
jgi:alanine dehydrogenase